MSRSAFIRCLTIVLVIVAGDAGFLQFSAAAQTATTSAPGMLTVMTYNLKFASSNPPNAWPQRRPLMSELIGQLAPDVFGTQEGIYSQLQGLGADLPAFRWIGVGRDGGSRGEFMAVFCRTARLEPIAFEESLPFPAHERWTLNLLAILAGCALSRWPYSRPINTPPSRWLTQYAIVL